MFCLYVLQLKSCYIEKNSYCHNHTLFTDSVEEGKKYISERPRRIRSDGSHGFQKPTMVDQTIQIDSDSGGDEEDGNQPNIIGINNLGGANVLQQLDAQNVEEGNISDFLDIFLLHLN